MIFLRNLPLFIFFDATSQNNRSWRVHRGPQHLLKCWGSRRLWSLNCIDCHSFYNIYIKAQCHRVLKQLILSYQKSKDLGSVHDFRVRRLNFNFTIKLHKRSDTSMNIRMILIKYRWKWVKCITMTFWIK